MSNSGDSGEKSETKETKKRGKGSNSKSSEAKRRKPRNETKSKTKAPVKVNLDKHCGVPLTNSFGELTGDLCVRSLTCKSHSMGAKRSVVGRSRPYDVLLTAYHQRNSLKSATEAALQQRNAIDAEADEDKHPTLTDAEEISAVLRGALSSRPQSLDRAVIYSTKRRVRDVSMKELLYKSVGVMPAPPTPNAGSSQLAAVMASTDAILGKCILFNPRTDQQSIRPSQIYSSTRMQNAFMERMNSKLTQS